MATGSNTWITRSKYMVDYFRSYGIGPSEIEVKLFGGSGYVSCGRRPKVPLRGQKRHGGPLHAEAGRDGGPYQGYRRNQGRKLHFYLHTGMCFSRNSSEMHRVIRIVGVRHEPKAGRFPQYGVEAPDPTRPRR